MRSGVHEMLRVLGISIGIALIGKTAREDDYDASRTKLSASMDD